jgi:uncharacterized repeat protein (TIGR03803 family)
MHKYINLRSILGISAGFRNNLVIAGIGSLAVATLTPETALAAPAITLKGSFDGANGAAPFAALTSAGNGKFYGTTQFGGAEGSGAIFEFDPSGSGSITLKGSFDGANGRSPTAALTSAGNGKFYGTTLLGGVNDAGAIFEFDPSGGGSITRKGSFDVANGLQPHAALTPAGKGKFYGTTIFGGAEGSGAIFEFDPSGSGSITLKGSFEVTPIGSQPFAPLTSAGNGKFYGTTPLGTDNGPGSIFEFDPSGNGSITLKSWFVGTNGHYPFAALTSAGNGKFYGTTRGGGVNNAGAIFEFDPSASGTVTLKGSFDGANGAEPFAALTSAGNGKFYGTTRYGGVNNAGVIFEFDPSGSGSITLKGSFDGANGRSPTAALTSAGNGKFYGTTRYGGVNDAGAIFEFDPGTNSAPAPAPLPLLGAGAAFGWSRRLRRRIQPVRPLFPIGR